MSMKFMRLITIFIFSLQVFTVYGQDGINWISFNDAVQRAPIEGKKVMVDIYTPWCRWCKVMEKNTFQDPEVVAYINQTYLAVKFNAEEEQSIQFKGKNFNLGKQGKRPCHDLAKEIMRGKMDFPTIVFLDSDLEVIQPISGYQNADHYLMVLRYFGEDNHLSIPWDKYVERYNSKVPANGFPVKGKR